MIPLFSIAGPSGLLADAEKAKKALHSVAVSGPVGVGAAAASAVPGAVSQVVDGFKGAFSGALGVVALILLVLLLVVRYGGK